MEAIKENLTVEIRASTNSSMDYNNKPSLAKRISKPWNCSLQLSSEKQLMSHLNQHSLTRFFLALLCTIQRSTVVLNWVIFFHRRGHAGHAARIARAHCQVASHTSPARQVTSDGFLGDEQVVFLVSVRGPYRRGF